MTEAMILIVSASSLVMIVGIAFFVKTKYQSAARDREMTQKPYLSAHRRDPQRR